MTAIPKLRISVEDYLAGELKSEIRHEYIDGEIHAMAEASRAHGAIVAAMMCSLKPHARRSYSSDMKVRLNFAGKTIFYYPDLVASCDPGDRDPYFISSPSLIVEVLSEATERIDRREKLLSYIRLESLIEYVIVEQARRAVEIYRRRNDWLPDIVEEWGEVRLDSLECTITLDDIYADLALLPSAP
ncbi:MAG: Uma2 family endonuclease [Rhodocyclaceae bacterium]|jgi:Uma2 family endonuclease|nr:Uma2 family endonuclease [Rhodocyclaceae bacterium]